MTQFIGVSATAQLRTAPYYRLVFEANKAQYLGIFAGFNFPRHMQMLVDELSSRSGVVFPLTNSAAVQGDTTAVIDVKPRSDALTVSVGEAARRIHAAGNGLIGLRSMQALGGITNVAQGAGEREAAKITADAQRAQSGGILGGFFSGVRDTTKWIALGIIAAAFIVYSKPIQSAGRKAARAWK